MHDSVLGLSSGIRHAGNLLKRGLVNMFHSCSDVKGQLAGEGSPHQTIRSIILLSLIYSQSSNLFQGSLTKRNLFVDPSTNLLFWPLWHSPGSIYARSGTIVPAYLAVRALSVSCTCTSVPWMWTVGVRTSTLCTVAPAAWSSVTLALKLT